MNDIVVNEQRVEPNIMDLDNIKEYLNLRINEAIYWWWFYIREMSWQLLIALLAYLCLCVFLYKVLKKVKHAAWQLPGPPDKLLLVIAHPDDEVMFFGPLLYCLATSKITKIYLLCLSTGGDNKRKEELWQCIKMLGIPEANLTIFTCTELPDDPNVHWPIETVAKIILEYIEMYKMSAVVTFDKYGISRHKNHISLYLAVAALCIRNKVPQYCKLYVLESVNIIRKYSRLLDLPISLLSASYWYLVTYEQRRVIKNAMAAHKSQYVWFRKLYMVFSRYTFINTLQEVNALDLELELILQPDEEETKKT